MKALLTDLYQLTMAAGYFHAGKVSDVATFQLSIRRLPRNRNYLLAAGLQQALEYLLALRFSSEELDYLRTLPVFHKCGKEFFDFLSEVRFTGEVWALPEGTPFFAGEPVLTVRAPIVEAQLVETYLLSTIAFQTMIASKAARVVRAAQGRSVVEFGTRRAHSPEAGVLGARAAFIGGCIGTSNALAGYRYRIPVFGTAAHSWVMAFEDELEAFQQLQKVLGEHTVYIVDTNDTAEGTRKAASLGDPIAGIRLDSGDLAALAFEARRILDQAGLRSAKIMASGDLDEEKIAALVGAGAPIDSFGVGTELATSADDPRLAAIYKLTAIESGGRIRYTAKFSEDKATRPAAKQIFRFADHDLVGCEWEQAPDDSQPLLQPVIRNGAMLAPHPATTEVRQRAERLIAELPEEVQSLEPLGRPGFPVRYSQQLEELTDQVRQEVLEPG